MKYSESYFDIKQGTFKLQKKQKYFKGWRETISKWFYPVYEILLFNIPSPFPSTPPSPGWTKYKIVRAVRVEGGTWFINLSSLYKVW